MHASVDGHHTNVTLDASALKIIAIEKEVLGLTSADFQPHLEAEARLAGELTQSGVIREMHFRTDAYEAVLILECADEQEARDVLATLPLVKEGLISFEVIGLRPYDGFSRLFVERPEE